MSDTGHNENTQRGILDFFVVLFCLCGAAASLYIFQQDLFKSLRSLENLPAGTVTVKYNTVQRRFKDRMIWDRLFDDSPVYNGDMIRVARLSSALLSIDNNNIELGENTMIQIQKNDGPANIDFFSGEVNITSSADSGIILLTIGDQVVQALPGTVFGASSAENGVVLRITEGSAQVISNGQTITAPAGTVIIQDAQGREISGPAAAVIQPRPNARYLKTGDRPLSVNFLWQRINMRSEDAIRLEIAEDRNFTRLAHVLDKLDTSAIAALNAGLWHWRLLFEDIVLAAGRVTVTEADAPTQYNAVVSGPDVQMRWSSVEEAAAYQLQISELTDFTDPFISERVQGTSFVMPDLDSGTWYWRVRPLFSSVYEGTTSFLQVSSFQIDRSEGLPSLSLNRPAHESNIVPEEAREGIYFSWSNSRDAVSYTIKISRLSDLEMPVISRTVNSNYFIYGRDETPLVTGRYYWSVSYSDARGNLSPPAQTRSFLITESEVNQRLVFPPDRYNVEDGQISALRFSWETNLLSDRRFQVSPGDDFSSLAVDAPVSENFYQGVSVPHGEWYWRVSARQSSMSQAVTTSPRRFTYTAASVLPAAEALAETAVEETPASPVPLEETTRAETAPPAPLRLRLISPSQGSSIAGLTALRQPTVFRWECGEEIASSRFVLSRNANPAQGRPEVEIINPGRTVTVNRLGEGLWYWTVIAQSRDGRPITSAAPGQFRVQSIPLLPAPGNRKPEGGYRIGADELRRQRNIVFSWNAVSGATSYILSIYRETSQGRRQILRTEPMRQLSYTLENLRLFDNNGTYVWQVEALHYNSQGVIEQRGRPGENTFILNVPRPGQVETRDTGVLYGN